MCIYRFLYHCIYIDFYSIVQYLDSMYILTVVIIISSIIFIFALCIVFILGSYSLGLLFIAEPYILMGLPWCWDCYLFILNKGVTY